MNNKSFSVKELKSAYKKLKIIDHPKRLDLIEKLKYVKEMNVTEIYKFLKIEQAEASHHLSLLRKNDIFLAKRFGKEIHYSLNVKTYEKVLKCIEILNKE